MFYAAELLRAWQAEDPPVEDEFVERIAQVVQSVCGGLPELASRERIRRICAYLGKPNYGERWWQIHLKLADLPLDFDRPPSLLVSYMKKLFTIYCTTGLYILRNTNLWAPRKTLLNYYYVFRQELRMLDFWFDTTWYNHYAHRFPPLKTREKIELSDQRWAIVCQQVNKQREFMGPEDESTPLEHRKWPYLPLLKPNMVFTL